MRLTLLGATGHTGRHLLDQMLTAGHRVTVLVRDPAKLSQRHDPRVTVAIGDATSAEDLKLAMFRCEAVVSAPGANRTSDLAGCQAPGARALRRQGGCRRPDPRR